MGALVLTGADIAGLLDLDRASVGDGTGTALFGDQLALEQGLFGRNAHIRGTMSLDGATIGGTFTLAGAEIERSDAVNALNADGLRVARDLVISDHARLDGRLRLAGAQIGGAARLDGLHAAGVFATRIRVEGDLTLASATLGEGLDLSKGVIGGWLDLSGSSIRDEWGWAVDAVGLHVGQGVWGRDEFTAVGGVSMADGELGRLLYLADADIRSVTTHSYALDLSGARVGTLRLPPRLGGGLDLTGARVGTFDDGTAAASAVPPPQPLRLAGLTYDSLAAGSTASTRLRWLAAAESGYLPQGYDQLASVLRKSGRDEEAAAVVIAGQRRKRRTLNPAGRIWSLFLDWTVGYGHRVGRAAVSLVVIVLVGWFLFSRAGANDLIATKDKHPPFEPMLYSLDAVLPIIDLGQQSAWTLTGRFQWELAVLVIIGWILATEVVAALTTTLSGLFKRD